MLVAEERMLIRDFYNADEFQLDRPESNRTQQFKNQKNSQKNNSEGARHRSPLNI